ncbi:hypothetical protein BBBOND_0304540 [Babesia bigemina]|uniref:Uncharacterized protein n=1 Tax=Babesia bigemina TaxID=5866 RepID=A0A061D757_BABBI|nr:hypothetical protein BBBOND_0304540 [Babesia bigemina]CDR96551.1 hypothetical protein BBBOND_0304540 [Babesia bigemina]|eukprot:XP_012768737.1 hypothetical protein BBBOND_0304540 [Babesia bigemina]
MSPVAPQRAGSDECTCKKGDNEEPGCDNKKPEKNESGGKKPCRKEKGNMWDVYGLLYRRLSYNRRNHSQLYIFRLLEFDSNLQKKIS